LLIFSSSPSLRERDLFASEVSWDFPSSLKSQSRREEGEGELGKWEDGVSEMMVRRREVAAEGEVGAGGRGRGVEGSSSSESEDGDCFNRKEVTRLRTPNR